MGAGMGSQSMGGRGVVGICRKAYGGWSDRLRAGGLGGRGRLGGAAGGGPQRRRAPGLKRSRSRCAGLPGRGTPDGAGAELARGQSTGLSLLPRSDSCALASPPGAPRPAAPMRPGARLRCGAPNPLPPKAPSPHAAGDAIDHRERGGGGRGYSSTQFSGSGTTHSGSGPPASARVRTPAVRAGGWRARGRRSHMRPVSFMRAARLPAVGPKPQK